MKILIKHRNEAQASKILEQERAEEFFQYLIEFGDPEDPLVALEVTDESDGLDDLYGINEADETFHWISGQYQPVEREE